MQTKQNNQTESNDKKSPLLSNRCEYNIPVNIA